MSHISSDPPPVQKPWKIVTVKAGSLLRCVAVAERYLGLDTHWNGKRTVPCMRPNSCEFCEAGHRAEWKGYMPARHLSGEQPAIVAITPVAATDITSKFARVNLPNLLGCVIELKRGRRANSTLEADVISAVEQEALIDMPRFHNMLRVIFGLHSEHPGPMHL